MVVISCRYPLLLLLFTAAAGNKPVKRLRLLLSAHFPLPRFYHSYQAIVHGCRSSLLGLLLVASLLLSGCVRYDVGIRFDSPNQGKIVQHIQLGEQLQSLSRTTAQPVLKAIEQRTRRLGGQLERLPNQELVVTIPFSSSKDLETKFNQFFSAIETEPSATEVFSELPEIESRLSVRQSNFLLVERDRLHYDLDLRSLGVLSANGQLLVSPAALMNLEFRLQTPWGARPVVNRDTYSGATSPPAQQGPRELVWQLIPGELNQLEATFWLPSPLGIGTLVIVILVIAGRSLKYPRSGSKTVLSKRQPEEAGTT